MSASAARLWSRSLGILGCAVLLAPLARPAVEPAVPAAAAASAGMAAGALLFAALAGPRVPRRPQRGVGPALAAKAGYLTVTAVGEELVWRWLLLGTISRTAGLVPALVASTAGFALVHARGQGRRGVAVHTVTGGLFGGLFAATGEIAAPIAAHAVYNLLIAAAAAGRPAPPLVAPEPPTAVASLERVVKRYGDRRALGGVSVDLREGEVIALLGRNGAGKTTAVHVLLGLRRPDEGRARLFGRDPRTPAARRLVGATPQETGFSPTLTVREIVDLVRAHFADPVPAEDVLNRFGLRDVADRQAGGLSGGKRRRLSVALAFAGRPRLVVLDEPTAGLDVESRRAVWAAVRAFAGAGGTVLLTTHHLEEAEALASRIVVLREGEVVADGPVEAIASRAGLTRIRVCAQPLPELPGVESVERTGRVDTILARDAGAVVTALVHAGASLEGLEVRSVSLEEAFVALTTDGP
jgi:ABC-2 type transport system ATP-binding protein